VCNQVLYVGEAWEQFSFKYQDERDQLFSNRVSPEFLKWFVWEISLVFLRKMANVLKMFATGPIR